MSAMVVESLFIPSMPERGSIRIDVKPGFYHVECEWRVMGIAAWEE
jgi:hypothetical protein